MEHESMDAQARKFLTGSDRQGRAVDYGVYSRMIRRSFERIRAVQRLGLAASRFVAIDKLREVMNFPIRPQLFFQSA